MAPKLVPLQRETRGLRLFPLFTILGWILIGFSILVAVAVVSVTAADYWGTNAKATRDAAEIGSALLSQLGTLAFWTKFLPALTFLGVASFMLGIAMEFAAIPGIIERRTAVLVRAVPLMGPDSK